ncbi:MAG: DJ-1/PfpI family protein [Actinomycetota bacterium]|nr:DJ-1/PfpI family protein [Actinomycetota bacterium]
MSKIQVYMFIEDLFEDSEAIYPFYRMKEEGYTVTLVAPEAGKEYRGKKGNSPPVGYICRSSLTRKMHLR